MKGRETALRGVCVTGATSPLADFLLPRLARAGFTVHALSRRPMPAGAATDGVTWHRAGLDGATVLPAMPGLRALIHVAPLWLLPAYVAGFAERGVDRIIAFGSTSRFTKADSAGTAERQLAARLAQAEEALAAACAARGVAWTIFRPTLTYADGRDGNIAVIARFIRRFGFFPLAGAASGRRQPVHADDLAAACLAALDVPAARNRAYNLPGGQELSYREMVEAVFRAAGRPPRFVSLPWPVWRAALALAALWPAAPKIGAEMVARMNTDMLFDYDDAQRDFGYAPRRFQP